MPRSRPGLRPLPLDLPAEVSQDEIRSTLFAPPTVPPPLPAAPALAADAPPEPAPARVAPESTPAAAHPFFGAALALTLPPGPAWSFGVSWDDGPWCVGWPSPLAALRCGYWARPRERLVVAPVQHLDARRLSALALRDWPLLLATAAHDLDPLYTLRVPPDLRQRVTGLLADAIAGALGDAFVPPSVPATVAPGAEIIEPAALAPATVEQIVAAMGLGLYDHDGVALPTRFFADLVRVLVPDAQPRAVGFLGELLGSLPTSTRHDLQHIVTIAARCLQHVA